MKPRVLLLAETPNWALHTVASAVEKHLSDQFVFDIRFSAQEDTFDPAAYDIIHVLFWEAQYYRKYLRPHHKVVKSVFSHRWQERGLSALKLYDECLVEAHAVTVPSLHLFSALQGIPPQVMLWSEGVDTTLFTPDVTERQGDIVVGWAGNIADTTKQLSWLEAACGGTCELKIADGSLSQQQMPDFYRECDVIACSSKAEGCPRPLIEGMACGAFPVSFDVGVAPEVIRNGWNGLLVETKSPAALRKAIEWCAQHPNHIRSMRNVNRQLICSLRQWESTVQPLGALYQSLL